MQIRSEKKLTYELCTQKLLAEHSIICVIPEKNIEPSFILCLSKLHLFILDNSLHIFALVYQSLKSMIRAQVLKYHKENTC